MPFHLKIVNLNSLRGRQEATTKKVRKEAKVLEARITYRFSETEAPCLAIPPGAVCRTTFMSPSSSSFIRISAYTNQSRVSHSVRMRENGAEVYPKRSSLDRNF